MSLKYRKNQTEAQENNLKMLCLILKKELDFFTL
jgi:hypothetical protein